MVGEHIATLPGDQFSQARRSNIENVGCPVRLTQVVAVKGLIERSSVGQRGFAQVWGGVDLAGLLSPPGKLSSNLGAKSRASGQKRGAFAGLIACRGTLSAFTRQ